MPTEACSEEFEALTAIFLDEIVIGEEQSNGETKVSMVLYPATGDDQESKFVTMTLELTLPAEYPKVSPHIRFRNPRGLSESLLDSLYRSMQEVCNERLESQMIFELIDMGKEFLTTNNRPASECPICLLSFTSCDIFYRSQCFHHFHSFCLGRYLQNVTQVAASGDHLPGEEPGKTCPVCRETLNEDIDVKKLLESPPPVEESLEVVDGDAILKEWHHQQQELQRLFEKQKSQGGIIDLTEIDKKMLVISSPRAAGDSDSPSSSDSSSTVPFESSDMLPMQSKTMPAPSVGVTGSNQNNIPSSAPVLNRPKAESRQQAKQPPPSTKNTACRPLFNNAQLKHPQVNAKSSQPTPSQDSSVPTAKAPPATQPDLVENSSASTGHGHGHHHAHHGRGKGGHYAHGRRRYK